MSLSKETREMLAFINAVSPHIFYPHCFASNKRKGNEKNTKIQDMSFCSHSVSLSSPLHQSKLCFFSWQQKDWHTSIPHAPTCLCVCHFNAKSRSHVLKFQQRPSEFVRKVWKTSQTKGMVSRCSCRVKQTLGRPNGGWYIKKDWKRVTHRPRPKQRL